MTTSDLDGLEVRCQELEGDFSRLAQRFGDASNALQQGFLPDTQLTAELDSLGARFAAITELIQDPAAPGPLAGLEDLRNSLARLRTRYDHQKGQLQCCRETLSK